VVLLTFITTILAKRIKWKWQYSSVLSGGIILVSIALALIIYQS
jgi:protein-S-isoprenylcysteine O-methyltransferase Ste14